MIQTGSRVSEFGPEAQLAVCVRWGLKLVSPLERNIVISQALSFRFLW